MNHRDAGAAMGQKAILFVCLGNICRSPLAEAALRAAAVNQGLALTVASAGTIDLHAGEPADRRAIAEAARHGIDLTHHRARALTPEDFSRFSHIYALDSQNLRDCRRLAPPRPLARISLLLDAVPGRTGQAVADPYYGDAAAFARTWDDVALAARHIVAELQNAGKF